MKITHIISTTDPINGFNIIDTKNRPHVVEGDHTSDLTIYFETKASLQAYLDIPVEYPEQNMSTTLSNSTDNYSCWGLIEPEPVYDSVETVYKTGRLECS